MCALPIFLLFNNRIYGLTKGQYSPTSEAGKVTKSTPYGSLDTPFNPLSVALGAEATFVARSIDSERKHLTSVLEAAARHEGTAFVEIYQNCNIFNDGAFEHLKDPGSRDSHLLRLEHGRPLVFGDRKVIRGTDGNLAVAAADAPEPALVHDAHAEDPTTAFALSRIQNLVTLDPTPIGVFRDVRRPTYDQLMSDQLEAARAVGGGAEPDLGSLLAGSDTWTVG